MPASVLTGGECSKCSVWEKCVCKNALIPDKIMLGQEHSFSLAVPPGLAELPLPTHCIPSYASFVNEVFSPSPILPDPVRFPVALRSPFSSANACCPLTIGSSLICKLQSLLTLLHRFIGIKLIANLTSHNAVVNTKLGKNFCISTKTRMRFVEYNKTPY